MGNLFGHKRWYEVSDRGDNKINIKFIFYSILVIKHFEICKNYGKIYIRFLFIQ